MEETLSTEETSETTPNPSETTETPIVSGDTTVIPDNSEITEGSETGGENSSEENPSENESDNSSTEDPATPPSEDPTTPPLEDPVIPPVEDTPEEPACPPGESKLEEDEESHHPSIGINLTYAAPEEIVTEFQEMYDFFLAGITDDMFMELTKEDTEQMLEEILIAAMPHFEFPRWADPFDLNLKKKVFTTLLTSEEMMIIRQYMISEWIGFQLATIELIKQKYSGSDFKFTSQAAHMKQLILLKREYEQKGYHLQRVYCRRRKDEDTGMFRSTFGDIMKEATPWRSKLSTILE